MIRSNLIRFAAVLGVTVAGCKAVEGPARTHSAPAPAIETGWHLYRSETHRFSISLPVKWSVFDLESDADMSAMTKLGATDKDVKAALASASGVPNAAVVAIDMGPEAGKLRPTLAIAHRTGLSMGAFDEDAVRRYKLGIQTSLQPNASLSKAEKIGLPIGAAIFSRVDFESKEPSGNLVTESYFIPNSDETYIFRFACSEANEPALSQIFRRVVDSLRLR